MNRWTTYAIVLGSAALAGGAIAAAQASPNTLTAKERAEGWRLLFDGRTAAGWRGFRQQTLPAGWQAVDGALTRIGQSGDKIGRASCRERVEIGEVGETGKKTGRR